MKTAFSRVYSSRQGIEFETLAHAKMEVCEAFKVDQQVSVRIRIKGASAPPTPTCCEDGGGGARSVPPPGGDSLAKCGRTGLDRHRPLRSGADT